MGELNLKKLRPYGDIMDDGTVQLAFTLPVEPGPEAREAAVQLVQKMGYDKIKVATMEKAAQGFVAREEVRVGAFAIEHVRSAQEEE